MTFAGSKFRSFLPAATFAMVVEFLMGLSDSVVCGHIVGEDGLAAVNLMQSVFNAVTFFALLVTIGTGVLFARECGAFRGDRAKGVFTLGFATSLAVGVALAVLALAVRVPYLSSFGVTDSVYRCVDSYYLWFLPSVLLQPVTYFLGSMCYTDGDVKTALWSYVVQLVVNCAASIPLTFALGTAGCALGTAIGALAALGVLTLHFRKEGCQLGFSRAFALRDVLVICRTSFGDASKSICYAVLYFVLNAYVVSRFGSDRLPVLAVVLMTLGISEAFDGVGNAIQPLVGVYVGEGNDVRTRSVMFTALKVALVEGGLVALVLLAFPSVMVRLVGIGDPSLVPVAETAVRLVACGLVGSAIVLLFNSYYIFVGHEILSAAMTVSSVFLAPLALFPLFGHWWGENGVWAALGLAPVAAAGLTAVFIAVRWGFRRFPLLLDAQRAANIRVFDLSLEPGRICNVSADVDAYLKERLVDSSRAARAALLVEETLMVVRERNVGRPVLAEVTVDLNKDPFSLVLRDDGIIFNITDADQRISSLRSYLVSNLMVNLPNRRNLTTTGFNRNVFRL